MDLLLSRGAEPEGEKNYSRESPLSWAAGNGHLAAVVTLLAHGASVNRTSSATPPSWICCWHLPTQRTRTGNPPIGAPAVRHSSPPPSPAANKSCVACWCMGQRWTLGCGGATRRRCAARRTMGHEAVVKVLLEKGRGCGAAIIEEHGRVGGERKAGSASGEEWVDRDRKNVG